MDSDISDVDKRPCSIDKSDVSTSLTHRRRPQQSTLIVLFEHSYRHCSHLAKIEGQTSTGRTRSSTYFEVKTRFQIDTATQACTWTTLRSPLHVHVLSVHGCIQKGLCGGMEKVCGRPFKMQSVGLVKTETFLGVA